MEESIEEHMTPQEEDAIRKRIPLRLSDAADVTVVLEHLDWLRAEHARVSEQADAKNDLRAELQKVTEQLWTALLQVGELRKWVEEYGGHDSGCAAHSNQKRTSCEGHCDCGWAEIKAKYIEKPKEEKKLCGQWEPGMGPCVAVVPCAAHTQKRLSEPRKLEGCPVCGSKLVMIRGKIPKTPDREICPTCAQEKLEDILQRQSPDYGRAVTEMDPDLNEQT